VAIAVGVASVAVGIGIPVFYETQIDKSVSYFFNLFEIFSRGLRINHGYLLPNNISPLLL
jgi:hypothetical protein